MRVNLFIFATIFLFSCSLLKDEYREAVLPGSLEEAVLSRDRAEENSNRDEDQHPLETLKFFGITPSMTVAEVSPGAGYYTEILAPFLAKNGQYIIVIPRMPSRPSRLMLENEQKLQNILLTYRAVHAKARIVPLEPLGKRNEVKPESVDMILSFSHVHNWIATNTVNTSLKLFHDLLKPNGVLGIVQHRISPAKKNYPRSGYLTEAQVISMIETAGFKLVEKSEINANPKDQANYPLGVWTLPPTYRLGQRDREKYKDIGESDRMTLKFVKR